MRDAEEVGDDFHVQFKISAIDDGKALFPWAKEGTTLEESIHVCKWLVEEGVDGLHVSAGYVFPHPRNPRARSRSRGHPFLRHDALEREEHLPNYLMFRTPPINKAFAYAWSAAAQARRRGDQPRGSPARSSRSSTPVLCAGGFQTASVIARDRGRLGRRRDDGPAPDRQPDLPNLFAEGHDRAPQPCTYCNKCLISFVENPLGCYEESRFGSREEMIRHIMSVYEGASSCRGEVVTAEAIFEPLALGPLTVEPHPPLERRRALRRVRRLGTQVRVNWDLRFARGGVGAIISSNAPVHPRGAIVPGYAHIDSDESIPFWRELGKRVREAGCPYVLQIVHAGRERIVPFPQWDKALSSSSKPEPLNGFPAEAMTVEEIGEVVELFARAARRAKEAGSTASRWPARTGCSRRSSSPRRSTTATTPTAGRSRTAPASGSRSSARSGGGRPRLLRGLQDLDPGAPRRADAVASAREHARGVAADVPLARGGRR